MDEYTARSNLIFLLFNTIKKKAYILQNKNESFDKFRRSCEKIRIQPLALAEDIHMYTTTLNASLFLSQNAFAKLMNGNYPSKTLFFLNMLGNQFHVRIQSLI